MVSFGLILNNKQEAPMFFRTKKIKKSTVLQLVKNMRDKRGKVSQKIVVSLGNLPVPNRERKEIAQEVENRLAGHQSLFPLKPAVSKWSDIIMKKIDEPKLLAARYPTDSISGDEEIADGVLIDRVEHENETDLGTVLVLKTAWERLGVGDFLRVSGFSESQINAAAASRRVHAPDSRRCMAEYRRSTSYHACGRRR